MRETRKIKKQQQQTHSKTKMLCRFLFLFQKYAIMCFFLFFFEVSKICDFFYLERKKIRNKKKLVQKI